jgi:hypothetical protein
MINENIKYSGALTIELRDATGAIKETHVMPNAIMNVGFAHMVSRLKDASAAVMSYMSVGTNSTLPTDATKTDLISVIAPRVAFDSSPTIVTKNVANDTIQFVTTFGPGICTGALYEAGIFNALTGGIMLCRTVFTAGVINKGAADSMTITWKVTAA